MAQVTITKDGETKTYDMDDKAYGKLLDAADDSHYEAQEYPKYVDTPAGPAYVADKDAEAELHKNMPKEGDVPPQAPFASGGAGVVTPMFPGDGYAYVDNVRVSDERNPAVKFSLPQAAVEPAKGPIRTVSEAAIQDVTYTMGDHVEAGRAKAQENKDALADAKKDNAEKSGTASAAGAVTTAADMGAAIPHDTVAITSKAPVPNAPGAYAPADGGDITPHDNGVPTSHPNTGGDMGDSVADGRPAPEGAADEEHA